ncbi:MAG TPA: hypothetical protein VJV78_32355, partial [Polyangiales bacterium]|nr:hypothetical protein [Polyangiales bacterium]
ELGAPAEPPPEPGPPPESHALQNAVREWFTSMSQHGPLLIAVDDFHRIDEPSAALLTLLATQGKRALCLIATMVSGTDTAEKPAQKLLLECASRLSLEPLALPHTESLLKSLFGDVSNLAGLARRLQEITAGNPRDLLRLAGHLVDGGQARYEAGAWTLPSRIDQVELPSSMEQALRSTLGSLPNGALTLATGFALCPDRLFSMEECALLQSSGDMVSLRRDLDCLLQAEVVRATEDRFGLALPAWGSLLADGRSPALTQQLHARLAAILEQRGDSFRAGQHWLRAGQADRGLNVLVTHARTSQEETARDNSIFIRYARSLPGNWLETFDEAIRSCERLGRPKRDAFILRGRLIGIIAAFGASDLGHMEELLRQLKHDGGLDDLESLDESLEPQARVKLALERAAARYAATPEEERVFEPKHAMTVLSRAISVATGRVRSALDVTYLRDLPSITPLIPAVPAFAVLDLLREGIEARFTGRIERAHELYSGLLQTLNQPDHGLERSYAQSMYATVMNASGQLEAYMGLDSCLELAARIEEQPTRRSGAMQLRALYHLFQGNARECDACKKQLELLRVESMQLYEGSSLVFEITAHSIADDMTRMRHVVEELRPLAEKYPAWRAVAHFGAAEYQRMRKADERAAAEIELGLQLAQPGVHPLWANLAAAHVRSVAKLESAQAALELARAYAAKAQTLELGCSAEVLHAEVAICEALNGCESAERSADALIERLGARGIGGLLLGFAYETRAQVALLRKNTADCDVFMQRCEQIYLRHKNAALRTKCERLRRMVNPASNRGAQGGVGSVDTTLTGTRVVAALESCQAEQRGRLTLTLLAAASGSRAGFLFTVGSDGLQCTAAVGNLPLPPGLVQHVIDYVESQREYEDDTTQSRSLVSENVVLEWQDAAGRRYRPVLLSHAVQDNLRVVGVAVLEVPQGQPFKYPADTATAVSRFWVDSASSLLISGD